MIAYRRLILRVAFLRVRIKVLGVYVYLSQNICLASQRPACCCTAVYCFVREKTAWVCEVEGLWQEWYSISGVIVDPHDTWKCPLPNVLLLSPVMFWELVELPVRLTTGLIVFSFRYTVKFQPGRSSGFVFDGNILTEDCITDVLSCMSFS